MSFYLQHLTQGLQFVYPANKRGGKRSLPGHRRGDSLPEPHPLPQPFIFNFLTFKLREKLQKEYTCSLFPLPSFP
jgi:hypothetical protein